MQDLVGKTAFVTGGASGIGFALGRTFAEAGMPGFVSTRIFESGRNRPERYGPVQAPDPASSAGKLAARQAELERLGLDPIDVAAQMLTAIRENELYVFTHAGAEWRAELKERFDEILRAMDKAAARQGM